MLGVRLIEDVPAFAWYNRTEREHQKDQLTAYYLWERLGRPIGIDAQIWAEAQRDREKSKRIEQIETELGLN